MVLSFGYLGQAAEAKDSQCVQFENLQLQATLNLLFSAQAWTRWGLSQGPPACCACVIPLHNVPSGGRCRPAQLFSSSRKKANDRTQPSERARAPFRGRGDEKEKDLPACAGGCAPPLAQIPEVAWRGRTFQKAPTPSSVPQSTDLAAEIFEGARGGSPRNVRFFLGHFSAARALEICHQP